MASTKKTTTAAASKVEAPIDNRETFVSLQKNFGDSDMPVEEKLKTIYALQAADSEIDKIIQLRGELPAEVFGYLLPVGYTVEHLPHLSKGADALVVEQLRKLYVAGHGVVPVYTGKLLLLRPDGRFLRGT